MFYEQRDMEAETHSFLKFAGDERELREKLDKGKIYRLNDRFFKYLFGLPKHKRLFLALLNNIVFPKGEDAFRDLKYVEREYMLSFYGGKECYIDLLAELPDGRQINLEVQVKGEPDYERRSVFYLTLLHSTQLDKGNEYSLVCDTISIHILDFNMFKDKSSYRNSFSLRNDETSEKLSDDLSLIYIELPKYKEQRVKDPMLLTGLERWLFYLSGLEDEEMQEHIFADPDIKEALSLEKLYLGSRKERLSYIMSFKGMMDAENREKWVQKNAMEKGMEKGKTEGKMEMALNLLDLGVDEETVVKASGMTTQQVRKIKEGLAP